MRAESKKKSGLSCGRRQSCADPAVSTHPPSGQDVGDRIGVRTPMRMRRKAMSPEVGKRIMNQVEYWMQKVWHFLLLSGRINSTNSKQHLATFQYCTFSSSSKLMSLQQNHALPVDALMHSIDEDVEKMNFKLLSIEKSIQIMLGERQGASSSLFSNQVKSRQGLEAYASKLLLSRKMQQDKLLRLRLKRDWEQESKLISDVAVPALNLPKKTAALVAASRNKLFEKKIQLLKWDSELKKMNLESVSPHQQRAFNACLSFP